MATHEPAKNNLRSPLLIAAASLALALPILIWGVPGGNDLPQHFQFAQAFKENVLNGVLHPGWAAEPNSGFGDVGIRFYPPFGYYVLTFFSVFTGSWWLAAFFTVWLFFFVGGLGVFYWAREWFSENAALFGAITYLALPYHVNQIYNAFFFAEFVAAAVLPFCFLFAARACRTANKRHIAGLSASYALLILSHIPSALFGSIALVVYSLFSLPKIGREAAIKRLGWSAALGLAASGFYWIRTASELSYLKHAGKEFFSGAFDFRINFLGAYSLVSLADYYDRSLWFGDLMLAVTLALAAVGALLHFAPRREGTTPPIAGVFAMLALGIFLATPLSLPIWENLTILHRVQFPFRLLGLIGLAAAMIAAAGIDRIGRGVTGIIRPLAVALFGMLAITIVFSATQIIQPALYIERTAFAAKMDVLASEKSCECWWPIWAKDQALTSPSRVSAGGRDVTFRYWTPEKRRFRIAAGEEEIARIGTFYYPRWRATVNGRDAALGQDANGSILIEIPAEEADVKLVFEESTLTEATRALSAVGWIIILWFSILALGRGGEKYRL